MFINLTLLEKHNLSPCDLTLLTAIKLNFAGKNEEYLNKWLSEDDYKRYEALEYVKLVKPVKKTDSLYKRLRISDKMSKVLNDLSCGNGVDSETETIIEWLIKIFKSRSNGLIRNKAHCKRTLQWFKEVTSISGNRLALLIKLYIQDCYNPDDYATFQEFKEINPRARFQNLLDHLFWKAPNDRAVHYTLDDSPLYDYFITYENEIREFWKQNEL